ncbi:homoserine O-acetyltransferase [Lepidopterella palustris CBS 459.81]|uniref:Homoserine O-acetyltransferase n=1 Tax=Lepidopterella palustris CBS 459.81 TaxID=1314670 RepID=A0A8E2E0K3_9PEZI|nr:homoserine O-acetyltransferase [Lepidopterella palustris CBS 459.81]
MDIIGLYHSAEQQNYYGALVQNQKLAVLQSFTLECGHQLQSVPIAYKTWGKLNECRNNVLVLCHALSGSSDAEDWWQPLMGSGKALDYQRFFIVCANMLGSPYGSASPVTMNPETGRAYGPDFPQTSIRDDVRIQKILLDALGVSEVAAVIGGSMGGMAALEWPLSTPSGYVKNIIPITTSAYHSAWGISWGEAQRLCIYADANYKNGWYMPVPSGQPSKGLGAARMIAMLTYRSYDSFELRFSRRIATKKKCTPREYVSGLSTPPSDAGNELQETCSKGGRNAKRPKSESESNSNGYSRPIFAAQSYMQYQAEKFLKRFDANCYIHLTAKMDTHDVTRDRLPQSRDANALIPPSNSDLKYVFRGVPSKALVISVESDVLFRSEQQIQLANCLPDAKFLNINSSDGHDGFLLEFDALGAAITNHLRSQCPWLYTDDSQDTKKDTDPKAVVSSVFGEAELEDF